MLLRQNHKERTEMIIPVNGVDTLADYEARREDLDKNFRPVTCPTCQKENTFWRHGKYSRKVFVGAEFVVVRINRFKCGDCALVVSCVFSFIVPYVRFAASTVSRAVQKFSDEESSYAELASEVSDLTTDVPPKPSSTQIFRWVHRLARRSKSLLFHLQKELVMRSSADLLRNFIPREAPNEKHARSEHKRQLLRELAELAQMLRLFTQNTVDTIYTMHAFFLCEVESLQSIFSGRQLRLQTTHSMQSRL
jgi:hypothetical protein